MDIRDSQRIKAIRDNTRAMAEAFGRIADALERLADRKDEPTISKMEQVETMSCAECKHRPIGAEICEEPCHYEPQTDCPWK